MLLLKSLSLLLLVAFAAASPIEEAPTRVRRQTTNTFPDPNVDPFYTSQPATLYSSKNGAVLKERKVDTNIQTGVKNAYQLYYRTQNTQNQTVGNVATVFEPTNPKPIKQILSYHTYEDSASFNCNPSWAFVLTSPSQSKAVVNLDAALFIQYALNQGIYVVVPDHEGPKAAFVAGYQEGMASLDAIRAIKNKFTLDDNTQIALTGYSGGAHVTAWTANLASVYAKELKIIGAAHGGTPVDLKETYLFLNGGPFAGFAGAGLVGNMNAYPQLDAYIYYNANAIGKQKINKYRSPNYCIGSVSTGDPGTNFTALINVKDPLNQPIPKMVLSRETLFENTTGVVTVPKYPRFQWHGLSDEIVPLEGELLFIKQQCAKGANIQFQGYPGAEHISAEILGIPGAILFLQQLFTTGTAIQVPCGTAAPTPATLTSPAFVALVGQATVNSLLALNGTTIRGEVINLYSS